MLVIPSHALELNQRARKSAILVSATGHYREERLAEATIRTYLAHLVIPQLIDLLDEPFVDHLTIFDCKELVEV